MISAIRFSVYVLMLAVLTWPSMAVSSYIYDVHVDYEGGYTYSFSMEFVDNKGLKSVSDLVGGDFKNETFTDSSGEFWTLSKNIFTSVKDPAPSYLTFDPTGMHLEFISNDWFTDPSPAPLAGARATSQSHEGIQLNENPTPLSATVRFSPAESVSVKLRKVCRLNSEQIAKSVIVDPTSTTMLATFSPARAIPECNIDDAARDMGFSHFQWVQVINRYPSGICLRDWGFLPAFLLPILDPPYGGTCKQIADYQPYYWDEGQDSEIPTQFWIESKTFGNFLDFKDAPRSQVLLSGQFMEFTTSLVGVISGSSYVPLYTWNWKSNYTSSGGGVFDSTARDLTEPYGGQGGIFDVNFLQSPSDAPIEVQDLWESTGGFMETPQFFEIEVKAGAHDGCKTINSPGVVPVVIFGSSELNVLEIDQLSLKFVGAEVRASGNDAPLCSAEFYNEDDHLDLKCKFDGTTGTWIGNEFEGFLVGQLVGGTTIAAVETICTRPQPPGKLRQY